MSVQQRRDADADLETRDIKALTEPLLVLPDDPDAPLECEVAVYSEDRQYIVNRDVGFCECPDDHYRDGVCKHRRRVAYEFGVRELPAWVDRDRLDDGFRMFVDGDGDHDPDAGAGGASAGGVA